MCSYVDTKTQTPTHTLAHRSTVSCSRCRSSLSSVCRFLFDLWIEKSLFDCLRKVRPQIVCLRWNDRLIAVNDIVVDIFLESGGATRHLYHLWTISALFLWQVRQTTDNLVSLSPSDGGFLLLLASVYCFSTVLRWLFAISSAFLIGHIFSQPNSHPPSTPLSPQLPRTPPCSITSLVNRFGNVFLFFGRLSA